MGTLTFPMGGDDDGDEDGDDEGGGGIGST